MQKSCKNPINICKNFLQVLHDYFVSGKGIHFIPPVVTIRMIPLGSEQLGEKRIHGSRQSTIKPNMISLTQYLRGYY